MVSIARGIKGDGSVSFIELKSEYEIVRGDGIVALVIAVGIKIEAPVPVSSIPGKKPRQLGRKKALAVGQPGRQVADRVGQP